MESLAATQLPNKPHAVCIPFPAQGHVTPMLHLAKLLHHHAGFHITYVNTHYNHRRLLASRGAAALAGLPGFCFKSIPDGLDTGDDAAADSTQDIPSLFRSTMLTCLDPFRELLFDINAEAAMPGSSVPPVTCIVSDVTMIFTLDAASELGVPVVLFWTASACSLMAYLHYKHLVLKGLVPLKDIQDLTREFMEMRIDWIPGLKHMRYKDLPPFVRTTDPDDFIVKLVIHVTQRIPLASACIINTFHDLEGPVIDAMTMSTAENLLMECKKPLPWIIPLGPLHLLSTNLLSIGVENTQLATIGSNLWKDDHRCIPWLDAQLKEVGPCSIVYVNFGSITVMTNEQLMQFAWGLAKSGRKFLWVIRPDLVCGDNAVLPKEFLEEIEKRGLLVSWCPQEEVLQHPVVGCFLTHSGWNSTVESVACGVPMICWPFFADQQINCRYACTEWGIATEIGEVVSYQQVATLIEDMMVGKKGYDMHKSAANLKDKAIITTRKGGKSFINFENLVRLLQQPTTNGI